MPYSKYFKSGQKILLVPMNPDNPDHHESLTVYLHEIGSHSFDLKLPYQEKQGEEYSFKEGMELQLSSESLGLGIRLTGTFCSRLEPHLIRVKLKGDLQAFQRRSKPRSDATIGLRYAKGRGTLKSFKNQWEKNVQLLSKSSDLSRLSNLPRYKVNIGPGGLRFNLKPPVEIADLCLVLMELNDKNPPICALAEVLWFHEQSGEERHPTGLQFINICKSDQTRLEDFVKERGASEDKDHN